jgi:LPS export ABC transporter protein LptC/lipopolysaccharide transport protein LptA
VSENHRKNLKNLELRANLPKIVRYVSIFGLAAVFFAISIGFLVPRKPEFRMKGFPTTLSKDVIAEVNNYERTETDGNVKKYYIRADKATTFADNHQELENIYLEVYKENGDNYDKITAQRAVYVPEEDKNFTVYLAGNVNVESGDGLRVKSENFTYKKASETVEAEELVEFKRENVSGKSFGAFVNIKEKRLELMKDVEINAYALNENKEFAGSDVKSAKVKANYALVDQIAGKMMLSENVFINIIPNGQNSELSQPTDIKSDRATATFKDKEIKQIDLVGNVDVYQKPTGGNSNWIRTKANKATAKIDKELKRLELFENVEIETTNNGSKPTKINSGLAIYEKSSDRFELKNGVQILTIEDNLPTKITSAEAVYEQINGKIFLIGNAEIDNGREYLKADKIRAELYPNKKIRNVFSNGNAFLRQNSAERTVEVTANELNAAFNENQQLQNANAVGNSNSVVIPKNPQEYTKLTLSAPNALRLMFRSEGLLEQMLTEGRTTILLNSPNNNTDSTNKKLTADSIKTFFNSQGKDLQRAEAVGNAELYVEPLRTGNDIYTTTINAPRFDCEFYPTGNNAKLCFAQTKVKSVRVPTTQKENRGTQTLLADKLTAVFNQQTQDIQQFDAIGNVKLTELDRNGIANQLTYTANDEIARMRGGEPTVWDSKARGKADEIDWDIKNSKTFLRGNVSTTYYNQKQTGGATPFNTSNKPVYITAKSAEFFQKEEIGVYVGNARAWQENNYVRAEKLILKQKEGQFYAEGNVQSVLYDVRTRDNSRNRLPVYASSNKLFYNQENRVLRYEENVDIRQGTDRITAGLANVFLNENNEMSKTVAENRVVLTQPNRKATGDWAQYTAATDEAILRGNPAQVFDAEIGQSQGAQVVVNIRENRVVNEAKTTQTNTGRIRSVYKIKKNQ